MNQEKSRNLRPPAPFFHGKMDFRKKSRLFALLVLNKYFCSDANNFNVLFLGMASEVNTIESFVTKRKV